MARKRGAKNAPRAAASAAGSAAGAAASAEAGRKLPLWGAGVMLGQLALMLAVFNPAAHNGGDTAGYVTLAHSMLEQGTYTDLWHPAHPLHTKYPPVFPMMLAAAIALGARTWAALKVVPALFTTLSVLAIYMWARDRRGAPFAASVALLTAGCNAILWASHWELSEPPFMALTFLSLWAYDRVGGGRALPWLGGRDETRLDTASRAPTSAAQATLWLALAGVSAGIAYFTRSAGIPLVVAAAAWLLLARRFRAAGALIAGVGLPALLWSLRGGQGAQYVSEFWMIDPYQPDLGRVGVGGLITRVIENTIGYMTRHVPVGVLGVEGGFTAFVGVALFVLAVWGWWVRMRGRAGVAELFVPMYLGLILLWPQVWSGDRFALPLIPLLLFYAGERLLALTAGFQPVARRGVLAVAAALIALPALAAWTRELDVSSRCGEVVRREGSFSCWGPRTQEFVEASTWAGANLPEGSVVLNRKPRIFYVMSGLPSEVYPFTRDTDRFFAVADSLGARYVMLDYMDNASTMYVGEALFKRGGAFCGLMGFGGQDGQPPTQLLGILPRDRRGVAEMTAEGEGRVSITLVSCPPEMTRAEPLEVPPVSTQEIPLLVGFRPDAR